MAKYHINGKGVPAICRATQGRCPYGGEGEHYDTHEEAQKAADKKNAGENGVLAGIGNLRRPGEPIHISNFKQSMDSFKGKDVRVSYDGKEFEGVVEGSYLSDKGAAGLLIKGENDYKHIKLHRIEDLQAKDGTEPTGMLKDALEGETYYQTERIPGNPGDFVINEVKLADKGAFEHDVFDSKTNAAEGLEKMKQSHSNLVADLERRRLEYEEESERHRNLIRAKYAKEIFVNNPIHLSPKTLSYHGQKIAKLEREILSEMKDKENFKEIVFVENDDKVRILAKTKDGKVYEEDFSPEDLSFDKERFKSEEDYYGKYLNINKMIAKKIKRNL